MSEPEWKTWRDLVKLKLTEWGPVSKNVFVLRMTSMMPPGYAWHRWVVDTKMVARLGIDREEGDELPEPTGEEIEKAQRALVLWFLRQLKRENMLLEKNGTIVLVDPPRKEKRRHGTG